MSLTADLYYSFRSPYSYLSIGRYRSIGQTYNVELRLRPVFHIAIRDPGYFERADPRFGPYVMRDSRRVAAYHGVPFGRPVPDPVIMNMETREISDHQPYIRPLTYLGVEASHRGLGLAFAEEIGRMIWGGRENWHEPAAMEEAASAAGLDYDDMQSAIEGRETEYEAEIEANQTALAEAGHWGVPTVVIEGEPFFGQDRVDMVLWRLKQLGLKERTT